MLAGIRQSEVSKKDECSHQGILRDISVESKNQNLNISKEIGMKTVDGEDKNQVHNFKPVFPFYCEKAQKENDIKGKRSCSSGTRLAQKEELKKVVKNTKQDSSSKTKKITEKNKDSKDRNVKLVIFKKNNQLK